MTRDERFDARLDKVFAQWVKASCQSPMDIDDGAPEIDHARCQPNAVDQAGHRMDSGRGTATLALLQFEYWQTNGRTHLLGQLDKLEAIEWALAPRASDQDASIPDYTYTLF